MIRLNNNYSSSLSNSPFQTPIILSYVLQKAVSNFQFKLPKHHILYSNKPFQIFDSNSHHTILHTPKSRFTFFQLMANPLILFIMAQSINNHPNCLINNFLRIFTKCFIHAAGKDCID